MAMYMYVVSTYVFVLMFLRYGGGHFEYGGHFEKNQLAPRPDLFRTSISITVPNFILFTQNAQYFHYYAGL